MDSCHGELLQLVLILIILIIVICDCNGFSVLRGYCIDLVLKSLQLNVVEIVIFRDVVLGLMSKIFLPDFDDMISVMIYDDV